MDCLSADKMPNLCVLCKQGCLWGAETRLVRPAGSQTVDGKRAQKPGAGATRERARVKGAGRPAAQGRGRPGRRPPGGEGAEAVRVHVGAVCAAPAPEIEARTGNILDKNPLPAVRPQAHGQGGREGRPGAASSSPSLPQPPNPGRKQRRCQRRASWTIS